MAWTPLLSDLSTIDICEINQMITESQKLATKTQPPVMAINTSIA